MAETNVAFVTGQEGACERTPFHSHDVEPARKEILLSDHGLTTFVVSQL